MTAMRPDPDPMDRDSALLATLQLADSTYPSGAYTLSHGLETLVSEGVVRDREALGELLRVALLARLARTDLVALLAVHDPGASGADVLAIDRRLAATKLAAEDRTGSERVGRRLAAETARLAPSEALAEFGWAIEAGRSPGNAAVAFGLAARALGIPRRDAALAAAASFTTGVTIAAVRLGLIGHGDAQRLIRDLRPTIVATVDVAGALDWRTMSSSAPQLEIALARHETAQMRLFAS